MLKKMSKQVFCIVSKNKSHFVSVILLATIIGLIFMIPELGLAGPGGKVVKLIFTTTWGRILLAILAVVFAPLIIYITLKEKFAVKKTMADLTELAQEYPFFNWEDIEDTARDALANIYAVWSGGDLSQVAHYFTQDFYNSQQEMLHRWRDEGKHNFCMLDATRRLEPLHVSIEDETDFSTIVIRMVIDVIDYMEDAKSGKLLKGNRKLHTLQETIWTFVWVEDQWLLNEIHEGSDSLMFANLKNKTDQSYIRKIHKEALQPSFAQLRQSNVPQKKKKTQKSIAKHNGN